LSLKKYDGSTFFAYYIVLFSLNLIRSTFYTNQKLLSRLYSCGSRISKELQVEAEFAVDLIREKAEGKPHKIPMVERKSWADLIRG